MVEFTAKLQAFDLLQRTFERFTPEGCADFKAFEDGLDILIAARNRVRAEMTREEQNVAHILNMLIITRPLVNSLEFWEEKH